MCLYCVEAEGAWGRDDPWTVKYKTDLHGRPEPETLRTFPAAPKAESPAVECKEQYYGLECVNSTCTQKHRLRRQL